MQEKLQREEQELKREKERLIEEREAQRLQRYVAPLQGSDRNFGDKSPPPVNLRTASVEHRLPENSTAVDRQRYSGPDPVVASPANHENPRHGFHDTVTSARVMPVQIGQPQQPNVGQENQMPVPTVTYQPRLPSAVAYTPPAPVTTYQPPVQSTRLPTSSNTYAPPRQSVRQRPGSFGPRGKDSDDRRSYFSQSMEESRLGSAEGLRQPALQVEGPYDYSGGLSHWRQSSYDGGRLATTPGRQAFPSDVVDPHGRGNSFKTSTSVSQPDLMEPTSGGRTLPPEAVDSYGGASSYRTSTSVSQPDMMRYLDAVGTPRPSAEPLSRSFDGRHPSAYPGAAPAHSRSASNPVVLRAHGANPSSDAVDSLFAYHQKSTPTPSPAVTRQESQSSQRYLPPAAAVRHISMQAASAAPAKPPRQHHYDYSRQDSDQLSQAEYSQQVSAFMPMV